MIAVRAARVVLLWAALVGLATAAAWSVRWAWADTCFQKETVEGTEKALSLTPDQAVYSVRLALLVSGSDPAKATAALLRAVALNPHDAQAWIELGLRYEADGNLPQAELTLRHAAEESRIYVPRWTLMNYYYRHADAESFWYWAKAAVPTIWGDALPLFHLCGRVSEDGKLIDRLDIRKPELQAAYLFYLLDVGRPDLVSPASRHLLEGNRERDVPLLLDACDRLLAAKRIGDATLIWDKLIARHRIPNGRAPGTNRTLLYNGDFAVSPMGRGFDWRLPAVEGISVAREERPVGLRFAFSGSQPEDAQPLFQLAPVEEKTAYVLTFHYRTSAIDAGTGLCWRVGDATNDSEVTTGESLASDEEIERRLPFVTPPGCRLVRIALAYQRHPGTTRISGILVLRDVELRPSTQPPPADRR
jgi:tetratricopeptide (TPR) repeat protein